MLNETINILNDLSLYGLKNSISNEIDYITNNNLSFLEGLNHFLKNEVKYREINRAEANIKIAHFPYLKEIKDFDFDYQPSINKDVINDLSTLRFIEEKKNVLFMGSPGVGKTHLATSLGIEAARKRNSVYFISCNDLITNLSNAFKENRLENKIKLLIENKELRDKLGKNAYKYITEKWTSSIAANNIIELFNSIINKKEYKIIDGPASKEK